MSDYFTYDDDTVMHNKLGITDKKLLHSAEEVMVAKNTARLLLEPLPQAFDFDYLLHIHAVLFGDVYDFAGQVRTVDIAKPNSQIPFAYHQNILPEAKRIFSKLQQKHHLQGCPKSEFVNGIVWLAGDLNALHPFREGNGRTTRLFLTLLASSAGFILDYSMVSASEIIMADKAAFEGNEAPLKQLYQKVIVPISSV